MFTTRIAIAFLCFILTYPLYAGKLLSSHVEHENDQYVIQFEMHINASPEQVYALITDYNHLNQLSENIILSKLENSVDENNHTVRLVSEACVLFLCKTIRQLQNIEEVNKQVVVATVIAKESDFDYAHASWNIRAEDNGTRVSFNADLKPSFWVPPLIGPAIIKSKLEDEILITVENLEKLASKK